MVPELPASWWTFFPSIIAVAGIFSRSEITSRLRAAITSVRTQFQNISSMGRDRAIQDVRDGMIVLDTNGKVVQSNPAAERLLDIDGSTSVGNPFLECIEGYSELVEAYKTLTASVEAGEQTISYRGRTVTVAASPIFDDRDRHIGWALLLQDITEQKRREEELHQQIEKLDQFAGVVSHDLRNPINIAHGYVQQTQATGELEYLDKTDAAFDRMETIIDDVLALAREGQEVTEPESVSLQSVAREAWQTVETGSARLEIPGDYVIVADRERLLRLCENLFRNAIEHGHSGEEAEQETPDPVEFTVRVGVHNADSRGPILYIEDNGTGIPEEKYEQVFESGYTTNRDGTGFGLAIVEQIATAHGWELSATNGSEGGARFEFAGVETR